MANYFPMALKGQARGWLMTQPLNSIHSWEDLCQQFITNFQGTYPRPGEEADLHALQRKDDESLCSSPRPPPSTSSWQTRWLGRRRGPGTPPALARRVRLSPSPLPALSGKIGGGKGSRPAPMTRATSLRPMGPHGPRARKKPPAAGRAPPLHPVKIPQGTIATLDGGACAHTSRRGFKAMRRELLAAVPTHKAARKARWSEVKLTFDQSDHPTVLTRGGKLVLVVSPTIHNVKMKRVLVDGGTSLSIISLAAFDALKAPRMKLQPSLPIIGVTPGHTWPLGHVELPVTFGDSTNFRTERIDFDVADLNLPYNAVLGRLALMPGPSGPIIVFGDVKVALACAEHRADNLAAAMEPQVPEASASNASKKHLASANEESALVSFMRANSDVFVWKPSDMPGVPREVIEHRLAVRPDARPIRQNVRRQAPERQAFIREEVTRLLEAGFIREVIHPEWLANPVVVPKANGKLRMCIDYMDLNKVCPKDPFPLPCIDQIVDSTAGCDLLSFLDAYSGYHQIRMAREDEEKTAFITPVGTFCYTTMPFGLKNAGPTFQRMTRITLSNQIRRNVEAYVDDLVVKTRHQETLLQDLAETFDSLRSTRMKLNPEKCVFGVPAGKLGFLVFSRGEKIRAIERMHPPANLGMCSASRDAWSP
uniref:Retrotransposon protein, putative, unclassified n=1 Tax=Oryza sativa subsp. japonica TaxID=39947 RepID=Q7G591_ORYSJ|nr:retrotransposon protein, putative, unclassified [Oryza sativa Japonica Group]